MGIAFILVEQVGLLTKTGTSLFAAVLLHNTSPLNVKAGVRREYLFYLP